MWSPGRPFSAAYTPRARTSELAFPATDCEPLDDARPDECVGRDHRLGCGPDESLGQARGERRRLAAHHLDDARPGLLISRRGPVRQASDVAGDPRGMLGLESVERLGERGALLAQSLRDRAGSDRLSMQGERPQLSLDL